MVRMCGGVEDRPKWTHFLGGGACAVRGDSTWTTSSFVNAYCRCHYLRYYEASGYAIAGFGTATLLLLCNHIAKQDTGPPPSRI